MLSCTIVWWILYIRFLLICELFSQRNHIEKVRVKSASFLFSNEWIRCLILGHRECQSKLKLQTHCRIQEALSCGSSVNTDISLRHNFMSHLLTSHLNVCIQSQLDAIYSKPSVRFKALKHSENVSDAFGEGQKQIGSRCRSLADFLPLNSSVVGMASACQSHSCQWTILLCVVFKSQAPVAIFLAFCNWSEKNTTFIILINVWIISPSNYSPSVFLKCLFLHVWVFK